MTKRGIIRLVHWSPAKLWGDVPLENMLAMIELVQEQSGHRNR